MPGITPAIPNYEEGHGEIINAMVMTELVDEKHQVLNDLNH